MEFFKELDQEHRQLLMDSLNQWREHEHMSTETCKARVAMTFQKETPAN